FICTANWSCMIYTRASGGTYTEANLAAERATLSFTGTAVSWISGSYTTTGIANVYLDGTLVATVDTYAPSVQAQVVMYTATVLPRGVHTLTIEATGNGRGVRIYRGHEGSVQVNVGDTRR